MAPRARWAGTRLSAVVAASAMLVGVGVGTAHAEVSATLGYDAQTDKGSLHNIAGVVGALDAYRAGYTGRGVGVALIDTGVTQVAGLNTGNVVNGPDLSFDSQDPATAHVDGFGHGTHMASIIAGRDAAGRAGQLRRPDPVQRHRPGREPDQRQGRLGQRRRGRQPGHRRHRLGGRSTARTRASTSGSSTCPTGPTRCRTTWSTRSPTPCRRPGATASSWSSPAATRATGPPTWPTPPPTRTCWPSARWTPRAP